MFAVTVSPGVTDLQESKCIMLLLLQVTSLFKLTPAALFSVACVTM